MKKFAYVVVAAFAAFLVTLGFMSSAQAYPDPAVTLNASALVVNSGDEITTTATANVECAWSETWNDEGRASAGKTFVAKYTAPQVTRITKVPLTATCAYAGTGTAAAAQSLKQNLTITVLPAASGAGAAPSSPGSADLPNSGGPNRVFLLSGLVLLLAGATAVTVARRRAEAEHPAPQYVEAPIAVETA